MRVEVPAESFGHCLLCQNQDDYRSHIQASPHLKYCMKIMDVGLKDNPHAGISFTNKQVAFEGWTTPKPILRWTELIDTSRGTSAQASASGTFGFYKSGENQIQFMTLEAISRGIKHKKWTVKLPHGFDLKDFAIYPQARVLAMVGVFEG